MHCWRRIDPRPKSYREGHLGIDDAKREQTKARYKLPYGDFAKVHRCGVLAAESWPAHNKYADIERTATHLHGMIASASAGR